MKHILLIATGGTIASKPTEAGLAPRISPEELLSYVPEIAGVAKVDAVQPFHLDSTNIYSKHWLELAGIIAREYDRYDGFVVTHGTDTMAYTAAALSYLVQDSPKPVVLTGSQKSVYLRDTDARDNLFNAFAFCADDGAGGVHIVFDGKVILGTRAKKTRTRSYNAFSGIDYPDTAIMRDGAPVYYLTEKPKGPPKFFSQLEDSVFVLKMIPGLKTDIFDYIKRCKGLIIESFGSGGLPNYENDAFFSRLKEYLAGGGTVLCTTQVEREGSALDRYEVGRKLLSCGSVLEARSMTLEAATCKLMWALAGDKDGVASRFLTPIQHDIF